MFGERKMLFLGFRSPFSLKANEMDEMLSEYNSIV